ncbi:Bax inhibitor-1/YccA family protein [Candidatus Dojkabacteria bacterium]|nr:Bax inhibitor-1/YccA family protein [Candidatus Dojkabacteria bacterium]
MKNEILLNKQELILTEKVNSFLYKTYTWMFFGLLITASTSYLMFSSGLIHYIVNSSLAILGLLLIQIGVVVGLTNYASKINTTLAGLIFIFYSVLTGITVTPIIFRYTDSSIAITFIASSIMFAIMAGYGYFTKQDLSTFGNIALMGLIGIILGAVINIFFNNTIINWIITYAGITIFLILTAYDMQKLKNISFVGELTKKNEGNIAIVGALRLYLDFINLFVFLLRIFGNRK